MVVPLVDESNLRCYVCGEGFADVEGLRNHQQSAHKDHVEFHERQAKEPAPGDVTVF